MLFVNGCYYAQMVGLEEVVAFDEDGEDIHALVPVIWIIAVDNDGVEAGFEAYLDVDQYTIVCPD
jgi:hypothetical protein